MIDLKEIGYETLREWIDHEKLIQLIDVRERWERETFNIGGEWYPMEQFIRLTPHLHEDRPVVIYCQKGIRSAICIQRLTRRFPKVQFLNLKEGIAHLHVNSQLS